MAICLPGIASRVKRAATSETRPAPAVMTMNCTITRMRKTTRPTTRLPPMTMWPNASMTLPACPPVRISRVEEMFRASRSSVVTSSRAGKTAKSSAFCAVTAVSRMITARVRLMPSSRSSRTAGSGTTMSRTSPIISAGTPIAEVRVLFRAGVLMRSSPGRTPCAAGGAVPVRLAA